MWERHADPEIRRVSKPGPETVYPTYVVGDSDKGVDDLHVAVEILFRRLLASSAAAPTPVPAPVPEPPAMERLLQRLVAETKVRQPAPVVASELAGFAQISAFGASGSGATASAGILPA